MSTPTPPSAPIPIPAPWEPRLLSRQEMAKRCGLSLGTLDAMVRRGDVPCIRHGRRVRFDPVAVEIVMFNRYPFYLQDLLESSWTPHA